MPLRRIETALAVKLDRRAGWGYDCSCGAEHLPRPCKPLTSRADPACGDAAVPALGRFAKRAVTLDHRYPRARVEEVWYVHKYRDACGGRLSKDLGEAHRVQHMHDVRALLLNHLAEHCAAAKPRAACEIGLYHLERAYADGADHVRPGVP